MRKVKVIHSKMDAPMNARNANRQNNANFALHLYFFDGFYEENAAELAKKGVEDPPYGNGEAGANKMKYELENAHVREVLFPGYLLLRYKRSHSLFYCAMANSLSLLRDKNCFR
jgi:hypothetical protein